MELGGVDFEVFTNNAVFVFTGWNNVLTAELPSVFAVGAARRPLLLPLALGGMSAVLLSVFTSRGRRKARQTLQRTPGSPSSSHSDASGPAPLT